MVGEEEEGPNDEEVFAPDAETVPYLTKEVLAAEKENDKFVNPQVHAEKEESELFQSKHEGRYIQAWRAIKELTNTGVLSGKGNEEILWKVVVLCDLDEIGNERIKHASLKNYFCLIGDLGDSLINFWSGDIWEQLEKLNDKIEKRINEPRRALHERVTKLVTRKELLTFIALIVGASNESRPAITTSLGKPTVIVSPDLTLVTWPLVPCTVRVLPLSKAEPVSLPLSFKVNSVFRLTAPDVTVKSPELNDATPLFELVASSPLIV